MQFTQTLPKLWTVSIPTKKLCEFKEDLKNLSVKIFFCEKLHSIIK